ncbi:receptor-like protein 43 [Hevea brasiliensis]|uniref:receptor-like protein 43 n=1 Tax=Hevea brasiliensis TaxID=3981 RepID=UPI0025FFE79C|nr:receptor-like protein 43 [Hevea brasiliensis]
MSLVAPSSLPRHDWNNSLQSLSLSRTKIQIHLEHDFISNLKSLETLDLSACNFEGSNLELFDKLTQLIELRLSHNNFSGQIPSSVENLKKLLELDLSHNNFNGQIPSSFENLQQLHVLYLQNNNLSGQIPTYFTNFTQLSLFSLSNNLFTGPMFQVDRLLSLYYLDLSNNLLNATIPASLVTLPRLYTIVLNSNQLTCNFGPFKDNQLGEVPSTTCKLKSLHILGLSSNCLNGIIPQCLGNFSNAFSMLHLGMNNFQGTIPEPFSVGCSLRYLNFNGSQLRKRVPLSISNCKIWEILDLGNNRIDGTCPHFLETLPELQVLVLQSNELHGMVKGSSTNYSFSKLQNFDLSNNMLSGPLPAEYFNNFKAMMNVDVKMKYMGSPNYNYDYSASLTLKGLKIELVKIQTLPTTIDLSRNKLR